MSRIQTLRAATSRDELAKILGFEPKYLTFVLFKIPDTIKYQTFQIPKRSGGYREIKSPCPQLKQLQRNLSTLLQDCIAEICEQKKFRDQLAHGFKRERSIYTNAAKHRKRRFVFNTDLEDFFPSINFGRVRGFFIKDANFMLSSDVATVIAQIACDKNNLPQGSPCSPVISNLIGHLLDVRLSGLAATNGCTYSRYADDLCFSTNDATFPSAIAEQIPNAAHAWRVGTTMIKIIEGYGFKINASKTRMQYEGSRQNVTGLVVNRKVNIKNDYRRTVKSMAHELFSTGTFYIVQPTVDATGKATLTKQNATISELQGMISHIDFVDHKNYQLVQQSKSASQNEKASAHNLLQSKQKLYKRFLLFRDFYSPSRAALVCEGKTDNIYLLHAIKSLAASHSKLATVAPDGKVTLKIRILKTVDSAAGRILRLASGWSGLQTLIEWYRIEKRIFKSPGPANAVILLIDNDDAFKKISGTVKKINGTGLSPKDAFTRILGNIYIVTTPLPNGQTTSEIEDCFGDSLKRIVLGGKTFSSDDDADSTKHFGKHILSQHVRQKAATIDFSGFAEVLNRIEAAINDFEISKGNQAVVGANQSAV